MFAFPIKKYIVEEKYHKNYNNDFKSERSEASF